MSDPEVSEVLRAWIVDELICLWASLETAHRRTNGNDGIARRDRNWSMECDNLGERIKSATDLVGPVSWPHIGLSQLIDGWFKWANKKIGIVDYDYPTARQQVENAALWRRHMVPRERVGFR